MSSHNLISLVSFHFIVCPLCYPQEHLNLSNHSFFKPSLRLYLLYLEFSSAHNSTCFLSVSHSTPPCPSQIAPHDTSLTLVVVKCEIPGITLIRSLQMLNLCLQVALVLHINYQFSVYFSIKWRRLTHLSTHVFVNLNPQNCLC